MTEQDNSTRALTTVVYEGTQSPTTFTLSNFEVKAMDDVTRLTNHPEFEKYQQAIMCLVDAPASLLRHMVQVKTSAQWFGQRERLFALWHANNALAFTVADNAASCSSPHPQMSTTGSTVSQNHPSYFSVSRSRHSDVQGSDTDELLTSNPVVTVHKSSRKIASKKLYRCGRPHCQNKQYKKLGSFKNHMTCVHQTTRFDPSAYLCGLDGTVNRSTLQTTNTSAISAPWCSLSSGSRAWDVSNQPKSSYDSATAVYNPTTTRPSSNLAIAPANCNFHDPSDDLDNSAFGLPPRSATPLTDDATRGFESTITTGMSWLSNSFE